MKKSLYMFILLASTTASQTISAWPFRKAVPVVAPIAPVIEANSMTMDHLEPLPAALIIGALFSFAHAGGATVLDATWRKNFLKLHMLGFLSSCAFAWHTKDYRLLLNYLAGAAAMSVLRIGHGFCQRAIECIHGFFSVQATPDAAIGQPGGANVNVLIRQ